VIRGVVFDFEALVTAGVVHAGIVDTIRALRERGIAIGAVTGRNRAEIRMPPGLNIDAMVCKDDAGANKGGGHLIRMLGDGWRMPSHEMAMVAFNERGYHEAVNAPVLSFRAAWGEAMKPYALRLDAPAELIEYLDIFFLKKSLWFAYVDTTDALGRAVTLRSLIDANGAGSLAMRNAILRTLKDRQDTMMGNVSLSRALVLHLIASAYLEGLLTRDRKKVAWQMYPGHSTLSQPPPVIAAALEGVKFVRAGTEKDALVRWSDAIHSSGSRINHQHHLVQYVNQPSTTYIPKGIKTEEKQFFVLDDFTTDGFSLENARNMLLGDGARAVTMLAFGKYRSPQTVVVPAGAAFKPREQRQYAAADFTSVAVPVTYDEDALREFSESMTALRTAAIGPKILTL
jgi:hypothetical protein